MRTYQSLHLRWHYEGQQCLKQGIWIPYTQKELVINIINKDQTSLYDFAHKIQSQLLEIYSEKKNILFLKILCRKNSTEQQKYSILSMILNYGKLGKYSGSLQGLSKYQGDLP